ncbi:MAG: hypothetical protein HDT43_01365 [Ruminococcaceae bacterium]|nr:hypothetical protein [Oscillospiraceae bacterium]
MSVKSFISNHIIPFKIIAAVIAFALIALLLLGANDLLGNPISYSLAKSKAEKYISEKYDGYVLESVGYSFKFKNYFAHAVLPGSEDCYFTVYCNMYGEPRGDNYESLVQNRGNVRMRLDMSYRELADSVLESPSFPYSSNIASGSLIFEGDEDYTKEDGHGFAIPRSILVPDALYDIAELGAQAGLLTVYVDTEELTDEYAAEVLLEINSVMEKGGVPFYAIDLRLESSAREYYSINNFSRSDIHEDGLIERVRENNQKTEARYAELDAELNAGLKPV